MANEVSSFDQSIPLVHGQLIQQGRIPNLDFYSFYPPLTPYINAGFFKLFGQTVLAVRFFAALLYLVVLGLAVRFFRSLFGPDGPLAPVALLLLATATGGAIHLPVWPGFGFALTILLIYLRLCVEEEQRPWMLAICGALTGAAVLCRVNFGACVGVVIVADLGLRGLLSRRSAIRGILLFSGSAVAVCAGICIAIYGTNITGAVLEFVVTANRLMVQRGFIRLTPTADVMSAIALPAAWFFFRAVQGKDRIPASALIAVAAGAAILMLTLAGRGYPGVVPLIVMLEMAFIMVMHAGIQRIKRLEVVLLLFFCCILHYFLSRADWDHWRLIPICCALLLPVLTKPSRFPEEDDRGSQIVRGTAFGILTLAVFVFLVRLDLRPNLKDMAPGFFLMATLVDGSRHSDADLVATSEAPPPAWTTVYPDREEWQALRYLLSHTTHADPIFVGVQDHSTVFWNNLRFYWLANRPIGTRLFQLETRTATEEPVQREIVADLERNKVSWLVLDQTKEGDSTFLATAYKGSTLLDEYIGSHFTESARFGNYFVLRRSS